MKNVFVVVATLLSSTSAFADGFVCESRDLTVKVYNHTAPSAGTRNVSVMVVSDPSIQHGRKTIAKFSDIKGTVTSKGAHYVANVDLRFTDSARKGENIGGTKLGELDAIELDIDFKYNQPLADGQSADGVLTLVKRNGGSIEDVMSCTRYLKN